MPSLASVTIGLVIASALFWLIERLFGRRAKRVARTPRDTRTDLIYWFFTPLATKAATRIAIGVVFIIIAWAKGVTFEDLRQLITTRQTWASSLPVWTQIVLVLLLADLLAYWSHRLFHGSWLWPFHAVHHSSESVDWLSSVRLHPLYWMGFSGAVLAAYVPFLTFYALLLHANLNWTYGPLRYVIASPAFHRWHHTTETEGLDKNFAGTFPFLDVIFGTFYMPDGRNPEHFGIANAPVPTGFLAQLIYPFRRSNRP